MEVYRNRGKCFQLKRIDWALTLRTPGDPEMSQSQPLSSSTYPLHLCLTSKASPSRKLLRQWTSQRREFHRISSHWEDNNSELRPSSQVPILKVSLLLPSKSPITVSCHAPVAQREEPGRRPGSSLLPHCQSQPLRPHGTYSPHHHKAPPTSAALHPSPPASNVLLLSAQPLPLALRSHPLHTPGLTPLMLGAPTLPVFPFLNSWAPCIVLLQVYAPARSASDKAGGQEPGCSAQEGRVFKIGLSE